MTRSAQLRRLHFLNALLAPLTGHDLNLAPRNEPAGVFPGLPAFPRP